MHASKLLNVVCSDAWNHKNICIWSFVYINLDISAILKQLIFVNAIQIFQVIKISFSKHNPEREQEKKK